MLFQLPSCGISLIIALCWLGVNEAVPFRPHRVDEVRPTISLESQSSASTRKTTPVTEKSRSVTGIPKSTTETLLKSTEAKRRNENVNNNVNINEIHVGLVTPSGNGKKFPKKQRTKISIKNAANSQNSEKSSSQGNASVFDDEKKQIVDNGKEEEFFEKCVNEARRQNESYTRSIPLNGSSIDPADDFKIAGEAEAKKTSSVHIGEDVVLCWIETTTVKEDPASEPPKRLVIREFTISFENSATIPDGSLECDKLEGEIAPGDEETVGKTSLGEVIDDDTKQSRLLNFTSVSHVGPVIVRQQRKVRCGVGAVVTKDIYEWPDGSDNPKKRVEIKVGPSIRNLGIRSRGETGECASESVPKNSNEEKSSSSSSSSDCTSGEFCETSTTCEDGQDCDRLSTSLPCEDGNCSAKSSSEEIIPTTYPPDSNDLLSTGVTRRTLTKEPEEASPLVNVSSPLPPKPDRANDDSCTEDDPSCVAVESSVEPGSGTERTGSSEDNSGGISTDEGSESCQEGSDSCAVVELKSSTQRPETDEDNSEGFSTNEGSESCQEGSDSCAVVEPKTGTQRPETDEDDSEGFSTEGSGESCQEGSESCIVVEPETRTDKPEQSEDNSEAISTQSSDESCREGSDSCSCNGASCSVHSSEESSIPETANKRTDNETTSESSVSTASDVTTESTSRKSSEEASTSLIDSECDSESGECLTSSESSSEEAAGTNTSDERLTDKNVSYNEEAPGSKEEVTTVKNANDESAMPEAGGTEIPDTIDATEESGSSEVPPNTEAVATPCNISGSEDCASTESETTHFSDEEPTEERKISSKTQNTEFPVTDKKESESSKQEVEGNVSSSSCDDTSEDENCKSTDSSHETEAPAEFDSSISVPTTDDVEEILSSATSEKPEGEIQSVDDAVTSMSNTRTNEETSVIEATGLPESVRNSSQPEVEPTQCSPGSESAHCGDATTSSSLAGDETTILPLEEENATSSPGSCESSGSCELAEEILDSTEENETAALNTTATTKTPEESICDESSGSCESSSSDAASVDCEDGSSSGDCANKSDDATSDSCDSTSGSCSSESSDPTANTNANVATITTTTEPTSQEVEHSLTTIDNVSTTAETRRSTVPSLSLTPTPSKRPHRLALRIKVLLEHINEKKEKEKLIQVEKNLLLNENPNEHGNQSLLWQIKALNNSKNIETLKALFNCSAFEMLTSDSNDASRQKEEEKASLRKKPVQTPLDDSLDEAEEENSNNSNSRSNEPEEQRKKRQVSVTTNIPEDLAKDGNMTEAKATALRESLPGVEEDIKEGLDHVLSRISKELATPVSGGVGKAAESSSSLLKILASPSDRRVHSRRRRRAEKIGGTMFVEQLVNPVKGEEIDRWSNERLVNAADGGKVRAVTEFKILRDAVEESAKLPS